jgi:Fructose-2,6-bisphosphatase
MTNIYFVRHCESDHRVRDEMTRPLSRKGERDCALVSAYLEDKGVSLVTSSPYKRAYETVAPFAKERGLNILCMDGFKEWRIGENRDADFTALLKRCWTDFDYKLTSGENLHEVQVRNIDTLSTLRRAHPNEAIAIGTHGMALSTIVNHFDKTFDFNRFTEIVHLMPWVVRLTFDGDACTAIESINLFTLKKP